MQVTIPPPQYDHPYDDGPVIEQRLSLAEARKLCQTIGNGYADGCAAITSERACLIVVPTDGLDTVSAYRRHEAAHCNGWPANHPEE